MGEKKRIKPPPLSSGSTFTTYFPCLLCDKHFHLHTNTQTSRHGILHRVDAAISFTRRKSFSAVPIGLHHVNQYENRGAKTPRWSAEKRCAKLPLGEKKKKMKDMKEAKFVPNWMLRISSLENCSSYISFPALSDNQCHITVWKVMNKVLAAALAVCYSTAECVCMPVCTWCVCVYLVSHMRWKPGGAESCLIHLGRQMETQVCIFLQYVWVRL